MNECTSFHYMAAELKDFNELCCFGRCGCLGSIRIVLSIKTEQILLWLVEKVEA